MSLFIGTLAFEDQSLMAQVRLGVLVASILSGLVASLVLVAADRVHLSNATKA
jgi:Na+:H+ antiporter, NhaA family